MTAPTTANSRLTLGTVPDSWGVWFARDDHQVRLPLAIQARAAGYFTALGLGPVRRWPY